MNTSTYTFADYREARQRFRDSDIEPSEELLHAITGLAAEVGEVSSIFQKTLQGHKFCVQELRYELGDVLWMLDELAECYDLDLSDIAQLNIQKLNRRYPNGFSKEDSIRRRDVLNGEKTGTV